MRRLAPRPLAPALEELAGRLSPRTRLAEVQAAWPSAVGEAIAREARPVAERDGVVEVACESAVWAQELDLMALDLVARVNAALGRDAVREMRCRVGGGTASRPPRIAALRECSRSLSRRVDTRG